jgi:hypothetical protein
MLENVRRGLLAAILVAGLAGAAAAQDMTLPVPIGMDGDPAARMVLDGNAAFLHGDLTAASGDYRAALARKPDFAIASFNLGLVEVHQGQRSRGIADMDRGIALASAHGMSHATISRLRALRAAFSGTRGAA